MDMAECFSRTYSAVSNNREEIIKFLPETSSRKFMLFSHTYRDTAGKMHRCRETLSLSATTNANTSDSTASAFSSHTFHSSSLPPAVVVVHDSFPFTSTQSSITLPSRTTGNSHISPSVVIRTGCCNCSTGTTDGPTPNDPGSGGDFKASISHPAHSPLLSLPLSPTQQNCSPPKLTQFST